MQFSLCIAGLFIWCHCPFSERVCLCFILCWFVTNVYLPDRVVSPVPARQVKGYPPSLLPDWFVLGVYLWSLSISLDFPQGSRGFVSEFSFSWMGCLSWLIDPICLELLVMWHQLLAITPSPVSRNSPATWRSGVGLQPSGAIRDACLREDIESHKTTSLSKVDYHLLHLLCIFASYARRTRLETLLHING